jgi:predicted transcriptional regulator of viral defense system
MPRRAASGVVPAWDALYDDAAPYAGHFTARWAASHGVSPALLRHHLMAGHLEKAGRGIYRFSRYPRSPYDEFVAIWLWSDALGVFSHETALLLHELSDALPNQLHLTVPAAWRKRRLKMPEGVVLHYRDVPDGERDWKGSLPHTTVLATLSDMAAAQRSPELVAQAARVARARGLLTERSMHEALRRGLLRVSAEREDA